MIWIILSPKEYREKLNLLLDTVRMYQRENKKLRAHVKELTESKARTEVLYLDVNAEKYNLMDQIKKFTQMEEE